MEEITQDTWFEVSAPSPEPIRRTGLKAGDPNPAVAVYGAGPKAARCRTCVLFQRHQHGRRAYGKCALRGVSHGPGTDHYASWPACGKYTRREEAHEGV